MSELRELPELLDSVIVHCRSLTRNLEFDQPMPPAVVAQVIRDCDQLSALLSVGGVDVS